MIFKNGYTSIENTKTNISFTKKVVLDILRQYDIDEIMSMDVHMWIEIRKAHQLPKQLDLIFIDSDPNSEARKQAYDQMVQKLTNKKSDKQIEKELNDELEEKNNSINYYNEEVTETHTIEHNDDTDEKDNKDLPSLLIKQMTIADNYAADKCNGEVIEFINT